MTTVSEQFNEVASQEFCPHVNLKKEEARYKKDYEGAVLVFDERLDGNEKLIVPFFNQGRHKNQVHYYLAQSSFDLSKETSGNKFNTVNFF